MSDVCGQVAESDNYAIVILLLWIAGVVLDEEQGFAHLYLALSIAFLVFVQFYGYVLFSVIYFLRLTYLAVSMRLNRLDVRQQVTIHDKRGNAMMWISGALGVLAALIEATPITLPEVFPALAIMNISACISVGINFTLSYYGVDILLCIGLVLTYLRLRSDGSLIRRGYGIGLICNAAIYSIGLCHTLMQFNYYP